MKINQRTSFKLYYALLISIIFSWSTTYSQTNKVILSGKVTNVTQEENGRPFLIISDFHQDTVIKKIYLDKEGNFLDTINRTANDYRIEDGRFNFRLYLAADSKYQIEYDASKFLTVPINFNGPDENINNYYLDKRQKAFIDVYGENKTEAEQRKFLNEKYEQSLQRIEKYKLPDSLKKFERIGVRYEYLNRLNIYLDYLSEKDSSFTPTSKDQSELDINYSNLSHYRQHSYYRALVDDYNSAQIDKTFKTLSLKPRKEHKTKFRLTNELILDENIRNAFLERYGYNFLLEFDDVKSNYQDFLSYYSGTNSSFKEVMLDAYLRLTSLKKGTPSPKFHGYRSSDGGTMSLDDLKGSYLYIDVWAEWCVNCWVQLPYLNQLEKELKGKNIKIIGVSIDKDVETWKTTRQKHQLNGIQLLVNKENDEFILGYAVNSIPRYIIIDPNGNIVDYNAPRPSEKEELWEILNGLDL